MLKLAMDNTIYDRIQFYRKGAVIRAAFEESRSLADPGDIAYRVQLAEKYLTMNAHSDPYIIPEARNGVMWMRNPIPPKDVLRPEDYHV